MNDLTYTRVGDYYIPDLTLGDVPDKPIGKYGRMRRQYLKEHQPITYAIMSLNGTLFAHLAEIDEAADAGWKSSCRSSPRARARRKH